MLWRSRRVRQGFLSITGRKKEIIITAGGKNIAPKNIEAALKESLLISEAMVIGDRRKFLSALISIDEANRVLARVEQIKKFAILAKPFGIDSGELTPTMKIKRKVVAQKFANEIDQMYVDEA